MQRVPNTNLVTNLPQGACVEVLMHVDKGGFSPSMSVHYRRCALMTGTLWHRGNGDCRSPHRRPDPGLPRDLSDPLTAAVLSLAEIKQMTNELFAQHRIILPQFKVHQV